MERVNRLILPIGMPTVLLLGLLAPALGSRLGEVGIGPLGWSTMSVILIFFINGLQIRLTGANDPALLRAIAAVAVANLIVAPALAWAVLASTTLPLGLVVGLAVMASVPTTLSSAAVIAINVGGDRLWALTLTITTVLLGSITAPLAVGFILAAEVAVSPWDLLRQVVLIVLVPTALGWSLRKVTGWSPPAWVGLIPSVAVLSVIWVTMSQQAGTVRELAPAELAAVVAVGVLGHVVLLGLGFAVSRGRPVEQAMPALFVTAQKTLPLALTIVVILSEQSTDVKAVAATATLVFVAWHFLQVFVDSVVSARIARSHASGTSMPSRS